MLVESNRMAIERRAYDWYEQGVNDSMHRAWQQAEREVLRVELLSRVLGNSD